MGRLVHVDTGWFNAAVPGTATAAFDALEVKFSSTLFGFLMRAKIMQSSEEGVTDMEQLKVAVKRGSGSYTSGSGTGPNATVVKGGGTGDAATTFTTAKVGNTTQASAGSGSLDTLEPGDFNVQAGEWECTYIPEMRPAVGPSEGIILSIDEAPADSITMRAILTFDIYGS